jgi:hypothetical protein
MTLSATQRERLRKLEAKLRAAVRAGEPERAAELAAEIQGLFGSDRRHHRLLRAKLWAFEAALDVNSLGYAETGFIGIRQLCGSGTRLYLEASILLAVCKLRLRKIPEAKKLVREVVSKLNHIKSDRTRRQFQGRLIERIEEECILTELIGTDEGFLDPQEIHSKAVLLIQKNSEEEIFALIGNTLPAKTLYTLKDIRDYSILLLPAPDRKYLPAPAQAEKPSNIGKKAFAVIRRIAWKAVCSPDSELFKLWSRKIPKAYNQAYFATAIVTTLASWRIGIPLLASGVVALVMKCAAHEFCELAKPKGLMIDRSEKED